LKFHLPVHTYLKFIIADRRLLCGLSYRRIGAKRSFLFVYFYINLIKLLLYSIHRTILTLDLMRSAKFSSALHSAL
jgi:hypothetical protein